MRSQNGKIKVIDHFVILFVIYAVKIHVKLTDKAVDIIGHGILQTDKVRTAMSVFHIHQHDKIGTQIHTAAGVGGQVKHEFFNAVFGGIRQ